MKPNENNFCGGAFPDWLEVNLLSTCNAHCSWCVEKDGYRPPTIAPWYTIAQEALKHGAKNLILLGGEPTLYANLKATIDMLAYAGRNVYITTNGSMLNAGFVDNFLTNLTGINISIHHFSMTANRGITGLSLKSETLKEAITELHKHNIKVRLNCNCIKNYIDKESRVDTYVNFAKMLGADSVRFAELKQEDESFVNLNSILPSIGLNDDPFTLGCNTDVMINDMPVNFRQMCGLQTCRRPTPDNPEQIVKKVLYYDGKVYDGWQKSIKEEVVTDKELVKLLDDVANGKVSASEAALAIGKELGKVKSVYVPVPASGGCQY